MHGLGRGRGCREQILTLALVGQTLMKRRRKKGCWQHLFTLRRHMIGSIVANSGAACLEGTGLRGRMVNFIRAAYMESKCEVKVGELMRESFNVVRGLRQGCVLSPVLFSLYANS